MSRKPKTILFCFFSLLVLAPYGRGAEIPSIDVLEVSSSGRSILLSRGESEGLKNGTVAKFYLQSGPASAPKLVPVAYGRAVKVKQTTSYWYLKQIQYAAVIKPGSKLVFIEKNNDVLPGRADVQIDQKHVVLNEGTSELKYIEDEKRGIPKELVQAAEDQKVIEELGATETHENAQLVAKQFDNWSTSSGLDYVETYMKEVQKKNIAHPESQVNKAALKRDYNEDLTVSQADGVAQKVNSLKDGLKDLYWKQERDEHIPSLQKRVVINNVYQDSLEKRNETRSKPISEIALAKAAREGKRWSSDMNDQELREYVVRTGISAETIRQRSAINELNSHELTLHLATSLLDHTSQDDENHRGKTYAFSLGYEYHLSRIFKNWTRWSVEGSLEWSRGRYQIGPVNNGTFQEGAYKLMVNYYLYNRPTTVSDVIVYVGSGIKVGEADAGSYEIEQELNYTMTAFPILQLGSKYRFISGDEVDNAVGVGFGLNAKLSIEPLSYSLENQPSEVVDGSFSVTDTKLYLGLSMYF